MYNWYAIRVRSNFEKVVQTALRNQDYEEFLPFYRKQSQWSDRVKTLERPLFPGYVFGRFDAASRLPVLMMPGVVSILGNSAGPVAVEPDELEAIRRSLQSGRCVMPWPGLAVGDRVVVEEGVLAGLEGPVVRVNDGNRLVITLTLLQRSVAVELNRDSVRPAGNGPAHPGAAQPVSPRLGVSQ